MPTTREPNSGSPLCAAAMLVADRALIAAVRYRWIAACSSTIRPIEIGGIGVHVGLRFAFWRLRPSAESRS